MPEDTDVCVRHLHEGCEFFKCTAQWRRDLEAVKVATGTE